MIVDEVRTPALIFLGYPFHPPGKPGRLRIEHLRTLPTPTLVLQGERNPLGNQAEVGAFPLAGSVRVHWLPDGDHDLTLRKKSGRTPDQNLNEAVDEIADLSYGLIGLSNRTGHYHPGNVSVRGESMFSR